MGPYCGAGCIDGVTEGRDNVRAATVRDPPVPLVGVPRHERQDAWARSQRASGFVAVSSTPLRSRKATMTTRATRLLPAT
jgi:hypothetical protein